MSEQFSNDSMLDMYLSETTQNIDQLENCILSSEKASCYSDEAINEIFRNMHSIKGSSAMMLFDNIANLAHSVEDVVFYLREKKPENLDYSTLSDLVLESVDFMKVELQKVKNSDPVDGDPSILIGNIKDFLEVLKQLNPSSHEPEKPASTRKQNYYIPQAAPVSPALNSLGGKTYHATIHFTEGCEMENIRAYSIVHNLKDITQDIIYHPEDIIENFDTIQMIREQGFSIWFKTDKSYEEMKELLNQTIFLRELHFEEVVDFDFSTSEETNSMADIEADDILKAPLITQKVKVSTTKQEATNLNHGAGNTAGNTSIISVNVLKLDKLMDLVGEMVIAEAMVTQNPDLKGLQLDNFYKASRQLGKIINEVQDTVMSIRMVPLSMTFQKMHRIVRDMSKKLDKEIKLKLIGEETEVDKNIIEQISDPLMHLVRNSIDHGIESKNDRVKNGKSQAGTITLEAKNAGSDVVVLVKDDGKGLSKEKILKKARENGILSKPEHEMTDKEIYNLIFLAGFSTKEKIDEFSGRGVGMDVVVKNLEAVGGSVSVDSTPGKGSVITLKIPLTLAIIDGMNIRVGSSSYTIPTTTIKESFRSREEDIIKDPDENEMIMVRGECYPVLRLHEHYQVRTEITSFTEGILVMVEQDNRTLCIFADQLLGQQQVVVKALPNYIKNTKKIRGLAGCTVLGDGSISLILDIGELTNARNLQQNG
ncbi:chemotaxis protein CheA [Desulfuribacillus stibiiarsenatis]|uniref:Chemotaxis protein CheA n=1 Tax=Desulfuribacillus stibiiarsenatis TaxID=1390249 RepID=A0A1E5L424_9FIRM|nr:chemotaxis protein CheA [Desulfuribacillus stibiiarsenatis]OEH84867.1 chemotaxis protein CheA [Desulfuribacillus stibiiarsenatis]